MAASYNKVGFRTPGQYTLAGLKPKRRWSQTWEEHLAMLSLLNEESREKSTRYNPLAGAEDRDHPMDDCK